MAKKIGKMWFKDNIYKDIMEEYNRIIEETQKSIIKLNQKHLIKWKA